MIEKIKKFFSSPLKSSLFTLVLTLLIVLVCVLVIKENNKLIDFPDAEGIALEAAGIDEFDFDAYTTHGGDLFCDIGYTIYYKVYFRAEEDGTEYACVVRAKDGAVMSLKHAEPEDAASPNWGLSRFPSFPFPFRASHFLWYASHAILVAQRRE